MVHYLTIIILLIIQLSLVSFFNAQSIALYIVCSQPIREIENNFLYSNPKTVKVQA